MTWTDYYCTPSGGGLHDGTSEANAWTWNEARGSLSPGDRLNVKAGTHDVGSVSSNTTDHGTLSNPIWFRGYTSTPGDLDGVAIYGLQDSVDVPLIKRSANSYERLKCNNTKFSNISFTNNSTGYASIYPSGSGQVWKDCRVSRYATGSSSQALIRIDQALQSLFTGCEFLDTAAGSSGYCVDVALYATLDSCFISVPRTTQKCVNLTSFTHIANCVISGGSIGCYLSANGVHNVVNCTLYNQSQYGIQVLAGSGSPTSIVNNIFHTSPTGVYRTGTYANAMSDSSAMNNSFYNVTTHYDGLHFDGYSHEDVTETSDPLTDPANGDFSLVATSGSYTTGFPKSIGGLTNKVDRGVFASQGAAGSVSVHPLYAN